MENEHKIHSHWDFKISFFFCYIWVGEESYYDLNRNQAIFI